MARINNQFFKGMIRTILRQRADSGLPMSVSFLGSVWKELVGEDIGAVTRPVQLQDGRLTVAARTEAWHHTLSKQSRRLMRNLNQVLPEEITAVDVVLAAPGLFPPELETPKLKKKPPMGSLPMADAQLLEDIEDDELRRIITRVRRLDRGNKE